MSIVHSPAANSRKDLGYAVKQIYNESDLTTPSHYRIHCNFCLMIVHLLSCMNPDNMAAICSEVWLQ